MAGAVSGLESTSYLVPGNLFLLSFSPMIYYRILRLTENWLQRPALILSSPNTLLKESSRNRSNGSLVYSIEPFPGPGVEHHLPKCCYSSSQLITGVLGRVLGYFHMPGALGSCSSQTLPLLAGSHSFSKDSSETQASGPGLKVTDRRTAFITV